MVVGHRHQPVALDAGKAGIAAMMGLADTPAIEDHFVAGLDQAMTEETTVPAKSTPGISGKWRMIGALPVTARPSL